MYFCEFFKQLKRSLRYYHTSTRESKNVYLNNNTGTKPSSLYYVSVNRRSSAHKMILKGETNISTNIFRLSDELNKLFYILNESLSANITPDFDRMYQYRTQYYFFQKHFINQA